MTGAKDLDGNTRTNSLGQVDMGCYQNPQQSPYLGDFYVTTNGTGEGTNWDTATRLLDDVSHYCKPGYNVWIGSGTYYDKISIGENVDNFNINDIAVYHPSGGQAIILNGEIYKVLKKTEVYGILV